MRAILILLLFTCFSALPSFSQLKIEVEANYISSVPYNEVRIPAKGGTDFDLTKDLQKKTKLTYRIRLNYLFAKRHEVSLLYAPLTIRYSGIFNRNIIFDDASFSENQFTEAVYKFNSYRLTYRYRFINSEKWIVAFGLTAKIRDASIQLKNGSTSADYPNVGFVPLINFYASWQFVNNTKLLLEGDALGTNKGRAEDIFAGITYQFSKNFEVKGGYRVLEGGADVEKIYNFTWVSYAVLGINIHL